MSLRDYRRAVKGLINIEWACIVCTRGVRSSYPFTETALLQSTVESQTAKIPSRHSMEVGVIRTREPHEAAIPEVSRAAVPSSSEAAPLSFPEEKIIVGGTKRGGDLLIKGRFSFAKDGPPSKKDGQQRLKCTVRNKNIICNASVMQKGDNFITGPQGHKCHPYELAETAANVRVLIREQGRKRPHFTGPEIANEALTLYTRGLPIELKVKPRKRATDKLQTMSFLFKKRLLAG